MAIFNDSLRELFHVRRSPRAWIFITYIDRFSIALLKVPKCPLKKVVGSVSFSLSRYFVAEALKREANEKLDTLSHFKINVVDVISSPKWLKDLIADGDSDWWSGKQSNSFLRNQSEGSFKM